MLERFRPAFIVTVREVRDQFRDWRIVVPIFVLTIFFPFLMNFTAAQVVSFVQRYGGEMLIGERLIPFLLMIVGFFPVTVSLVIALESFVGESERRSIEPLLSSPLTDFQLYLGKLLASLVPPLVASYLGVAVYLFGVWRNVGWTPPPVLLTQVIVLTAVQGVVMVSGAVVISTQTTSVRAANLLASFVIIPMALLMQGESVLMFWGRYSLLWWVIVGQLVLAGLLIRTGIAHFNREELLGRELDVLNLRWAWHVFWRAFAGEARSLSAWLRYEIVRALNRLAIPMALMALLLVAGVGIGIWQANIYVLPPGAFDLQQLKEADPVILQQLQVFGFFSVQGVSYIWLHNLRAVALATLLGIFSFGVAGVLVLMAPLALMGFLAQASAGAGFPPFVFLAAFLLPHGFLELPAIIVSGAAILRLGATLVTPSPGQTIGEAWLKALADWVKIVILVAVPLFLGAAILEVFVTPRTALMLLANF